MTSSLMFFPRSGGLEIVSCHCECLTELITISGDARIFISAGERLALFESLQLETEMETVVKVLQPGPLGIIEHKFSAEEIWQANSTVQRAVQNWRRNANMEQGSEILKDLIHK